MNLNNQKNSATAKAIVAPGRSVDVPDSRDRIIGIGEGGPIKLGRLCRRYFAGQEVELPIDEVVTLRKLGYLTDPENPGPPPQNAASYWARQRRNRGTTENNSDINLTGRAHSQVGPKR